MKIVRISVVLLCLLLVFVAFYRVFAAGVEVMPVASTSPPVDSVAPSVTTPTTDATAPDTDVPNAGEGDVPAPTGETQSGTAVADSSLYSANPDTTSPSQNPYAFEIAPGKDELPPEFADSIPVGVSVDSNVSLNLPVRSAILVAADTGDVLYRQNEDAVVPIASITKIMTMLLVFEEIDAGNIALTDLVSVSQHAANMGGSQIWLDPSESFTVDEMLRAVCVASANDAAVALAEHVAGSEPVFVEMMNRRAQQLGMVNTNFVNSYGLDAEGHLSTAYDVALMSQEILKHEELLKYTTIWTDSLRNGQTMLVNTNKLVKNYAGITGLKTGTTSGAGICLAATATRDGLTLISVVLGASNSDDRFDSSRTLLDFGFANYQTAVMPNTFNFPGEVPVTQGQQQAVPITYTLPQSLLLQKNQQRELTAKLTLVEAIPAPVVEGTAVGAITLYSGESEVGRYDVVTSAAVESITFSSAYSKFFESLFTF